MRDRLPQLTDRISLGDGLAVSPVCLGRIPDEDLPGSVDTACAAFDAGVNFFFVSGDLHWRLYALGRRALAKLLRRRGVRDQIVVAAVSYTRGLEEAAVGDLLAELPQLGRIDVLVGGGYYAVDAPRIGGLADAAMRAGARAVGATFHDRAAAPSGQRSIRRLPKRVAPSRRNLASSTPASASRANRSHSRSRRVARAVRKASGKPAPPRSPPRTTPAAAPHRHSRRAPSRRAHRCSRSPRLTSSR